MKKKKAVFNWSGGKDSAHALWRILQSGEFEIVSLLTLVESRSQRSTMHQIPIKLLQMQSNSIGIPLEIAILDSSKSNTTYEEVMKRTVKKFKSQGVTHYIFGDISLHDIRQYRIQQFKPLGIEVVEPLWNYSSKEIIELYLQTGLQTIIVTTTDGWLNEAALGQTLNRQFLNTLPEFCDPNGENGEYHTFCYNGPIFQQPISFSLGKTYKEYREIRLSDGRIQKYTYSHVELKP